MINIIASILLFNILIIGFKIFEKYKVNNLVALIVNYLTGAFCSYYYLESDFTIEYIFQADWLYHAIAIGALFIIVFNLYSLGIQKVGISTTTIANKMSVIIPVGVALTLYPENNFDILKAVAFLLALFGIYLSVTKEKKLALNKKYLGLILFVFLGQGISDATFNDFAQSFNNVFKKETFLFFMTLFLAASIVGIIIHLGSFFKNSKKISFKDILSGIFFGIPNFFCLFFFLKALKISSISSAEVFAIVSIGVVILSSLIGLVIFKEKLTKNNWIGILLSICSIYLFSY